VGKASEVEHIALKSGHAVGFQAAGFGLGGRGPVNGARGGGWD
jgi:hypothetical protein